MRDLWQPIVERTSGNKHGKGGLIAYNFSVFIGAPANFFWDLKVDKEDEQV